MKQLVVTIPSVLRGADDGDLEVLVRDLGGEVGLTADCRPAPGAIWRPVDVREETV